MSAFTKIVFIALAATSGAVASAHSGAGSSPFEPRSVIASHEAAPTLIGVAHHPKHRHHHRAKHRAHPVRHVR